MGPVVKHFFQRQVTEARPEQCRRPRPAARVHATRSKMQELTDAIRSLANGKAVGLGGVSVEPFKIILNGDPALRRRLFDIVVCIWRGAKVPQQWKDAIIMVLHKRKIGQSAATTGNLAGSTRRQDTADDHRSPPQRVLRARGDPAGGTEWFPTEPLYRRYDVCGSSATGLGMEMTNSVL